MDNQNTKQFGGKKMKKIFSTLFVFMLAVGLFAVPSDDVIQNAANELGIPFDGLKAYVNTFYPEPPESDVMEVTVQQYQKDYADNGFVADQKYKDKTLRFTITVDDISPTSYGYSIWSKEAYGLIGLSFGLAPEYNSMLSNISSGDRVIIETKGNGDNRFLYSSKIIQIL